MEEEKKPKEKIIQKYAGIVDYNYIESPFFINSKSEIKPISEILENEDISDSARFVLKAIKEGGNAVYRSWKKDNEIKEFIITGAFPTLSTFDVWNAIVGIYLEEKAPLFYSKETKEFTINDSEVTFKISDLVRFMKHSDSGKNYKKIKTDIIKLAFCKYTILSEGVYINKRNDSYVTSENKENRAEFEVINLFGKLSGKLVDSKGEPIVKGNLWGNYSVHRSEQFTITFTPTILDNIRSEYFKYYIPEEYYSLPSRGITRRLWMYIHSCKRTKNETRRIIRKLDTLMSVIPLANMTKFEARRRVEASLKTIKEAGFITDYIIGYKHRDIRGINEDNIYILFGTTSESYLSMITKGAREEKKRKQSKKYDDSLDTLFDIDDETYVDKISQDLNLPIEQIDHLVATIGKWQVVKYYLFAKEKATSNITGLFVKALTGKWDIRSSAPLISDFIASKDNPKKAIETKMLKDERYRCAVIEAIDEEIELGTFLLIESEVQEIFKRKVESLQKSYDSHLKRGSFKNNPKEQSKLSELILQYATLLVADKYDEKKLDENWMKEVTKILVSIGKIPSIEDFEN